MRVSEWVTVAYHSYSWGRVGVRVRVKVRVRLGIRIRVRRGDYYDFTFHFLW